MQEKWLKYKSQGFLFFHSVYIWLRGPIAKHRGKRSWERFFSRYFPMGFLPVGLEEYSQQPKLESCIGCSLCIWTCSCVQKQAPAAFNLPKRLVLNEGRSSNRSENFAMDRLSCLHITGGEASCSSNCTVACPQGVPLHFAADRIINWRRMRGLKTADTNSIKVIR